MLFRYLIIIWAVGCLAMPGLAQSYTDDFSGTADMASRGYSTFGFFNSGGGKSYSVDDVVNCTLTASNTNNTGDCFWVNPLGTQQLANVGDYAQLDVRVNVGTDVVGEALYRSGPGLYLSSDQHTVAGTSGHHSIQFVISNMDNDTSRPRRVIVQSNNGAYSTGSIGSADDVWAVGDWVTLKVTYTDDSSGHVYEFQYDSGSGFVTIGSLTMDEQLPYVAPYFHYSGYFSGVNTQYPVADWASFDNFYPGREPFSQQPQTTYTETFESGATLADHGFVYFGANPSFNQSYSTGAYPIANGRVEADVGAGSGENIYVGYTDVWWYDSTLPLSGVGDYAEITLVQRKPTDNGAVSQWGIILGSSKTAFQGEGDQIWMTMRAGAPAGAIYPQYNPYHDGLNEDNAYSSDFGFNAGQAGDTWRLRITVREISASGWKVTCAVEKNGGGLVNMRLENGDPYFEIGLPYVGLFFGPEGVPNTVEDDFIAMDDFVMVATGEDGPGPNAALGWNLFE